MTKVQYSYIVQFLTHYSSTSASLWSACLSPGLCYFAVRSLSVFCYESALTQEQSSHHITGQLRLYTASYKLLFFQINLFGLTKVQHLLLLYVFNFFRISCPYTFIPAPLNRCEGSSHVHIICEWMFLYSVSENMSNNNNKKIFVRIQKTWDLQAFEVRY